LLPKIKFAHGSLISFLCLKGIELKVDYFLKIDSKFISFYLQEINPENSPDGGNYARHCGSAEHEG